jgi:hypothetical protein
MFNTFRDFTLLLKQLPASIVASNALLLASSNGNDSHWESSGSEAERTTTDRAG